MICCVDTAALDAFFATAEDVLTDWHGSTDAMHARVPDTQDAEALPGNSYYEQRPAARFDWQPVIAEWAARYPDVMRASEVPPIPEWNRGRTLAELSDATQRAALRDFRGASRTYWPVLMQPVGTNYLLVASVT